MRKADYFFTWVGQRVFLGNYYRMKQRKLGIKLGFSIACDTYDYGLVISHYGTIVVGNGNKIGNYAVLHTSICITNGKKVIGDCLYVSTEANSVVTKLCDEDVVLLLGMLASIKKKQDAWYSNNERYFSNIQKFEKLREIIYG